MFDLPSEQLPIGSLTPYEKNAKKHPSEQVQQIVDSIRQFGMNDPIAVWGPTNLIVEGHGRLLACKKLGIKTVPVIRLDHLSEEQRKAYALAHNKLTMNSDFDFDMLTDELAGIVDIDMTAFGFDLPEDKPGEVIEDEFDATPPEEPITKLGDIWQLGRHRLMCGDSTDAGTVALLMDGKKADMVFTDPPWNVNYGADMDEDNAQGYKPRTIMNDSMSTDEFKRFMLDAYTQMGIASKDGAMVYVVMSAQEWGNNMLALTETGFHWSSTIIWNKDHLVMSRKDYHTKYEPIWYGWKDGAARLAPLIDRKQSDVWDIDRPIKSDLHPTMKPIALVARAIENSSKSASEVLDLFGGSGSTLIACEQLNRACYMMELDPRYCDVIIHRWETLTGETAKLL